MTTITIDGAQARLNLDGTLEFQPRDEDGVHWLVWYRDTHYDGWTYATVWAANKDIAAAVIMPGASNPRRVEPEFKPEPIGWTCEQETQAKVWAGKLIADARKMATRFARAAE